MISVKERPILFSAPMVRALLAGTKMQTRRVVKTTACLGREALFAPRGIRKHAPTFMLPDAAALAVEYCPYGQPGDRLWVREAWTADAPEVGYRADMSGTYFRPDHKNYPDLIRMFDRQRGQWRPSIHMPRWASRITLEITGVRVERLQDISDADALAEGVYPTATGLYPGSPKAAYRQLWGQINGPGSYEANPWVWVIDFKRICEG